MPLPLLMDTLSISSKPVCVYPSSWSPFLPSFPSPLGQPEEVRHSLGFLLPGGLPFLPSSSWSCPAPDTSKQGQGAPGEAVDLATMHSLPWPQDVISHHLKLAPGWTAAEAAAVPKGLRGMCENCCSREKYFPCSLGTAFVCLCSDTNLFNCLVMIGFSLWNWKTQPLQDRGREKQLSFIGCCLAWTKDIEIRQRKRKISVLPIKDLIMHRAVQAQGRLGREKGLWSGRIPDTSHAVGIYPPAFFTP